METTTSSEGRPRLRVLRYAADAYTPLEKNTAFETGRQHALCFYRQNAIYTFIPKNACSTMRVTLAFENGCIDTIERADWIHSNNITFQATLRDLATASYAFVILRCPYQRLASLYLDKMRLRDHPYWGVCARDMTSSKDPSSHGDPTFREFIEYILRRPFSDIHWRPQNSFLIYKDYDDYFSFETLEDTFRRLEARLGIKIRDARELTRHGQDRYEPMADRCYADTPISVIADMNRDGGSPTKASLFDDGLRQRVGKFYAADIALYRDKFGQDRLLFPR